MPDPAPVVVLISADPRVSHRANEAMRIALGIVAGDNDMILVLTGAGAHLLDADTDDLVDGDDIAKFRASLKKLHIPFHVEESAIPADSDWNAENHTVIPVRQQDIVGFLGRATRFIVF